MPRVPQRSLVSFGVVQPPPLLIVVTTVFGALLRLVLRLFGRLPLRVNHAAGGLIGKLAWWCSSRHRATLNDNLRRFTEASGLSRQALLPTAVAAQGEGLSELCFLWSQPLSVVYSKIREVHGWHAVEQAQAEGKPIIFASPHLGSYDMAGRFIETRVPITALFRPPKQAWLAPFMQAGRQRGAAITAPASAAGVRQLIKALKAKQSIFVLPDQVPAAEQGGDGVWVDFFGRPAFTMTLLGKLARSYDCAVVFVFAERLPKGQGFDIHCVPMREPFHADPGLAARQSNAMVEQLILLRPEQYLWSYNRYKQPAGAPAPPSRDSAAKL